MAKAERSIVERGDLATRLADARARTDEIFSLLHPPALYERPVPERHRLVFYLGHLEAFDWNLVARQGYGMDPFDEPFDRLFAFGIDPTGGGLPNEAASDWPNRERIDSYNRRVRDRVDECLLGGRPRRSDADETTLFNMAIEHRLMHAETLAYLLHQLPFGAKEPARVSPAPPGAKDARSGRVRIPPGKATLGQSRAENGFGWDNEFEAHAVDVAPFSMDVHKVSNGRYLDFVRAGGYAARRLWSEAGWDWKERRGVRHPHFWLERGGEWLYRGMFAATPLPLDSPVYVSHAEASAFAAWAEGSLPTESQFHRAAYGAPDGRERLHPWGSEPPGERHGNFNFRHWDPTPLGAFPGGDSAFGVSELVGNGWEWTTSVFEPFPGFRPHPLYAGYSADFFDGKHFVLKGASQRTAASMLRRSFRNWFQPHYPYAYAAFRLAGG